MDSADGLAEGVTELGDDAGRPAGHHPAARPGLVGPLVVEVVDGIRRLGPEPAGVFGERGSAALVVLEGAQAAGHGPEGEAHDDARPA